MKLRFTPRAIENLSNIADYLRSHSPAAASRVRAAIYASLQNLILFPNVGRPQRSAKVRKLVTRKYAYLIYYKFDAHAEEIIILNVKHPAQNREHPTPDLDAPDPKWYPYRNTNGVNGCDRQGGSGRSR